MYNLDFLTKTFILKHFSKISRPYIIKADVKEFFEGKIQVYLIYYPPGSFIFIFCNCIAHIFLSYREFSGSPGSNNLGDCLVA